MKHASHKATKVSRQQFSLAKVFLPPVKGPIVLAPFVPCRLPAAMLPCWVLIPR